jgi:hypothetical protein
MITGSCVVGVSGTAVGVVQLPQPSPLEPSVVMLPEGRRARVAGLPRRLSWDVHLATVFGGPARWARGVEILGQPAAWGRNIKVVPELVDA